MCQINLMIYKINYIASYVCLTKTTSSIGITKAHIAPLSPSPMEIQQLHECVQKLYRYTYIELLYTGFSP